MGKSKSSPGAGHEEWASTLAHFGAVVLDLYRLATRAPAGKFQSLALDAVRAVLGFDSAVWGVGVMGPQGPIPHTVHSYRQPAEMMAAWERIKQHDTLFFEALGRQGETIRATAIAPEGRPAFHPAMVAHAHRYGMEQVLNTVFVDPAVGMLSSIAFYRADAGRLFSEPERQFKQNRVPHLAETWRINRLVNVGLENRVAAPLSGYTAMFDKQGLLRVAGPDFAALMQAEWPDWKGPKLPEALLAKSPQDFRGERIVVAVKALSDMLWLSARKKVAVDQLSTRELDVATRFGQGMSYHHVAASLHISPATVRNHLKNIYAKLGICNKVDLVQLLRARS
jgi:DNA-binding CsgD family transcriptional regulator